MRWIFGVEPTDGHEGTIQFAAWLKRHGFMDRGNTAEAAFVLPKGGALELSLTPDEIGEIGGSARERLETLLERSLATGALAGPSFVESSSVEQGLEDVRLSTAADAIVVGRRAERGKAPFIRLGPVARKLLRSLPSPVVVVPPDLGDRWRGDGPVLLGTDLAPNSSSAARFAAEVAEQLGRQVTVVHCAEPVDFGVAYVPPMMLEKLQGEASHLSALREWCDRHGVAPAAVLTRRGDPVTALAQLAVDLDAAMVVLGSRRLSTTARLFSHSCSLQLAGVCWAPLAVVPS